MSTATATETATAPAKKGKKKLIIIVGALVLVLGLAGGGGALYLKKKAADEAAAAEAEDGEVAPAKKAAHDPKAVPTFVPLDPFTVNLADREAERYAQIAVSLELSDAHGADKIKTFMPIIRNNVLMVLAHKTSAELLERDGKTRLAAEIVAETSRALGYEVEHAPEKPAAEGEDPAAKKPKKKAMKDEAHGDESPVVAAHFSSFIIQ